MLYSIKKNYTELYDDEFNKIKKLYKITCETIAKHAKLTVDIMYNNIIIQKKSYNYNKHLIQYFYKSILHNKIIAVKHAKYLICKSKQYNNTKLVCDALESIFDTIIIDSMIDAWAYYAKYITVNKTQDELYLYLNNSKHIDILSDNCENTTDMIIKANQLIDQIHIMRDKILVLSQKHLYIGYKFIDTF